MVSLDIKKVGLNKLEIALKLIMVAFFNSWFRRSNRSKSLRIKDGKCKITFWKDLIVGDIVVVLKD